MSKSIISLTILLLLAPLKILAGPKYVVECNDVERGTEIQLYDVNPSSTVLKAFGIHYQLPEKMKSFEIVNKSNKAEDYGLRKAKILYKPYEVEIIFPTHEESLIRRDIQIKGNGAKYHLDHLDRIILENHSPIKITNRPRLGAVILILDSGLRLRFNNCKTNGDSSVSDWEKTFNLD